MKRPLLAIGIFAAALQATPALAHDGWGHDRGRHYGWDRHERWDRHHDREEYRERRLYRGDRVWRGNDGNYHCRRSDGTTGLVIGAAVGGLVGRSLDDGRDRTLGTVLGMVGGGLLGRSVDRGNLRCR